MAGFRYYLAIGRFSVRKGCERGTKIVIHLNELGEEFGKADKVQDILEKHSNFVSFPVVCVIA